MGIMWQHTQRVSIKTNLRNEDAASKLKCPFKTGLPDSKNKNAKLGHNLFQKMPKSQVGKRPTFA